MKNFREYTELNESPWSRKPLRHYATHSKALYKRTQKKLDQAINEISNNEDTALALLEILDAMKAISEQVRVSDELALSVANNGK